MWADAERGQVVVPAGDDGPTCGRVLVEGTEVESVDVGFPAAGTDDDQVVGAAVDEAGAGQRHRLGSPTQHGQPPYPEAVRP